MIKWIGVGTVLQVAMVVTGHWVAAVAAAFGLVGMAISLLVGLLWAREASSGYGAGAGGGALVGGVCALLGIVVSFLLGDVTAVILAFGTLSSAVTGLLGGLLGHRLRPATAERGPAVP
jgi:hypothetical protein